jgi:hypothetical protein
MAEVVKVAHSRVGRVDMVAVAAGIARAVVAE